MQLCEKLWKFVRKTCSGQECKNPAEKGRVRGEGGAHNKSKQSGSDLLIPKMLALVAKELAQNDGWGGYSLVVELARVFIHDTETGH
jgi:hypothetical protein